MRLDLLVETLVQLDFGPQKIVAGLQVEPELRLHSEEAPKRRAESAVTDRFPWTISLIRRCATLMLLAIRYWVIPIGSRNSSNRISPGWIGSKSLFDTLHTLMRLSQKV